MKHLSCEELIHQAVGAVKKEKQALLEVFSYLEEIERRALHLELGYRSLSEFAVQVLQYSDGSASRRVHSMRLCREFPEVRDKLLSGALSLENLTSLQIHSEINGLSPEKKRELLHQIEGKSQKEARRILTGEDRVEILKPPPPLGHPFPKKRGPPARRSPMLL